MQQQQRRRARFIYVMDVERQARRAGNEVGGREIQTKKDDDDDKPKM